MRRRFGILVAVVLAGCAARPQAPVTPALAPTVPLPPPPPKGEPDLFTGVQAAQLRQLVGAPAFTRRDGITEMWRYDTASCHAFFFLTGTPAKVQHVETLPRGKDAAADPVCLSALRASAKTS
jgi:hypothetical protein